MSAVGAAKLTARDAEITVVDKKKYDTFHPCAMPFVIGGYLQSINLIIEDLNYRMMGVDLIGNAEVTNVDIDKKKAFIKQGPEEKEEVVDYDQLILCTGSYAFIPSIPGRDLENVFSLKWIEDAKAILEAVKEAEEEIVQKVVVVGGSAIGIEVASELSHRGRDVTIIEMEPQLMPFKASENFAKEIKKELIKTGVKVQEGMALKEIIGGEKVRRVCYGHERTEVTMDADIVILATGVRPNVELAKKIGVELGKYNAIKVNERMETNIDGIYAAGDCVQVKNIVSGEDSLALFAGPAVRQGRVAGINATGGNEKYPGTVNSALVSSRTFFLGLAGLNADQAKELGLPRIKGKVTAPTKPHYMPKSTEITIQLIAHEEDGKILGGEILGKEKVDANVNYIAMAIQNEMTVYDLMDIDFCYAPAVSETIYPIVKAADAIIRRLERKKARAKKKK